MISSKRGKLYLKFVLALAVITAAIYSYSAIAAVPSASPAIANTNGTTIDGVQIANASVAKANGQLFVGGAL